MQYWAEIVVVPFFMDGVKMEVVARGVNKVVGSRK
jgi:hypothetical protein